MILKKHPGNPGVIYTLYKEEVYAGVKKITNLEGYTLKYLLVKNINIDGNQYKPAQVSQCYFTS